LECSRCLHQTHKTLWAALSVVCFRTAT
jgi:hypothetical protein